MSEVPLYRIVESMVQECGVATALSGDRDYRMKGSRLSYRSAESFAGDGLTVPIVRTLIDQG